MLEGPKVELGATGTEFNPLTEVVGHIGEVTLGSQGHVHEDEWTRVRTSAAPGEQTVVLEPLESNTQAQ